MTEDAHTEPAAFEPGWGADEVELTVDELRSVLDDDRDIPSTSPLSAVVTAPIIVSVGHPGERTERLYFLAGLESTMQETSTREGESIVRLEQIPDTEALRRCVASIERWRAVDAPGKLTITALRRDEQGVQGESRDWDASDLDVLDDPMPIEWLLEMVGGIALGLPPADD